MNKPSSSRHVANLVRPLVEAQERVRRGLFPWERWNGLYRAPDGKEYKIPSKVAANDLDGLYAVLVPEQTDEAYADCLFEAIQRTAFVLGYEWSNGQQRFVHITGNGQYAFDRTTATWRAL